MDERLAKPPPPGIPLDTNAWTAPFWDAVARHELLLPRCGACGRFRMPPTPFCPQCRSQEIDWVAAPGEAILYSYTIVERAIFAGMEDSLPYVPAVVAYPGADGVRLISNIIGSRLGDIRVGARLKIDWHVLPEGASLPVFRIVD